MYDYASAFTYDDGFVDTDSCEKSDNDNVALEEAPTHSVECKDSNQLESAGSGTVISQVGINLGIEDSGLETSQDPVCVSDLDPCSVNAAASFEEAAPRVISTACEAARDTQSEAKKIENDLTGRAVGGEQVAPDVIRPSRPRHNISGPMRPSRDIRPIGSSVSTKPRRLRPSRGVQPIRSRKFAVSVLIENVNDVQTVLTGVTALSASESDPVPHAEHRKRAAAEQILETTKRVKPSDGCRSLVSSARDHS